VEGHLAEEMRLHRAMLEERFREEGSSASEARNLAAREFGPVALSLEDSRAEWSFAWLESLVIDVRYAACPGPRSDILRHGGAHAGSRAGPRLGRLHPVQRVRAAAVRRRRSWSLVRSALDGQRPVDSDASMARLPGDTRAPGCVCRRARIARCMSRRSRKSV
jgi:hypothetical protein